MSIVNPSAPDSSVCIPVLHHSLLSRVVYYEHPPMWWHSGVKISPQLLRRNVKFCYFILFYFIVFIFLQQELYQEGHFISSQTRCSNQYHMHSQIQSRTILCVSNLYFGVWQMGFGPPLPPFFSIWNWNCCHYVQTERFVSTWNMHMKYGGINTIWAMLFY